MKFCSLDAPGSHGKGDSSAILLNWLSFCFHPGGKEMRWLTWGSWGRLETNTFEYKYCIRSSLLNWWLPLPNVLHHSGQQLDINQTTELCRISSNGCLIRNLGSTSVKRTDAACKNEIPAVILFPHLVEVGFSKTLLLQSWDRSN